MRTVQARLEKAGEAEVSVNGATHTIRSDMVTIDKVTKTVSGQNYTPSVIEPSFGIGRILYCVFEHTFYTRPGETLQRTVFRFSPIVAPMKTTVFPLLQKKELNDVATSISLDLRRAGISSIIDTTGAPPLPCSALDIVAAWHQNSLVCRVKSASEHIRVDSARCAATVRVQATYCTPDAVAALSICLAAGITIGKRYARTDELGVPFAITVDYDTLQEGELKDTVTLRERDSMQQVRVPVAELVSVLKSMCELNSNGATWADMRERYPAQAPPADA